MKDTLYLHNEADEADIIAAGAQDPLYGEVQPDNFTAYARIRFGKCLPLIAGPESISGSVFGMHPAVIARSYQGILHKQMNMGHKVTYLGAKEDRICGCVLGAGFPEEPEGGWVIPESVSAAPSIEAFCVLHKQAKGVSKMLGDHLAGKVKMAVSMEFSFFWNEVGIYVPDENLVYERDKLPSSLKNMVVEDSKGKLILRKTARNPQLVLAIGGNSGRIIFSGVGYTDNPAESTAAVDSFAAEHREGMLVCGAGAAEVEQWAPAMPVCWSGGQYNRGTIAAVHYEGSKSLFGKTLSASFENPVLEIKLPDGKKILRRSASVKKNFA